MENLKTIGSLLKDSRISQSFDLNDIAEQTKINLKLLRFLEDDQLSQLPNRTYVVGFVKSYAKHLGLNEEEALLSLNYTYEQKVVQDVDPSVVFNNVEEAPTELEDSARAVFKTFYNKKAIIVIVASIAAIMIIKTMISFFSNIAKEKVSFEKKEVISPVIKADTKITDKVNKEKKAQEVQAVKEVKEPKKELVKDLVQAKDKKETKKILAKDLNGKFPYKDFYPVPLKLYTVNENAPENEDTNFLPTKYKNSMIEGLQNVYIHATEEDTWISFKVDDQKIKRYVLKKGRSVLLKGNRVLLFMGNINASKIFLNNQLITAQSKTGVKSLVFPQENAADYKLPLFPTYQYKSYTAEEYIENMMTKED